jgi:hypothetical protein
MRVISYLPPTLAWACLLGHLGPALGADRPLTRQALIEGLRTEEGLVRSAECWFENVQTPTKANAIPVIREACRLRGEKNYGRFITSEAQAKSRSSLCHWLRSGPKERLEYFDIGAQKSASPRQVQAFDGVAVRSLSIRDGNTIGSVKSVDAAHWNNSNRLHPFTLIWRFNDTPYSEILAEGRDYAAAPVPRGNEVLTRVSVRHPTLDSHSFVFLFGPDCRMLERRVIVLFASEDRPRLNEIHTFAGYERFDNLKGEPIWFPRRAEYHFVAGVLPDGSPAVYETKHIRIRDITFNVDIPDAMFELKLPESAKVYDDLTGQGWLEPGVRPAAVFPEEARPRWLLVGGVVALAAVVTALVVALRIRRRRAAPG